VAYSINPPKLGSISCQGPKIALRGIEVLFTGAAAVIDHPVPIPGAAGTALPILGKQATASNTIAALDAI